MGRAAVFVDFDRTLVDCDAGVVLGRALVLDRIQEVLREPLDQRIGDAARLLAETGWMLATEGTLRLLYLVGAIDRSTLVRNAYRFLAGVPAEEVLQRMGGIFDDAIASRFHPEVLSEVRKRRDAGAVVVVVSTGMKPLLEHAKRFLGEDVDILACDPEIQDGRFTGEVDGPLWGGEKLDLVERFARDHDIDLAASAAYSDHLSDLPLLEAVGEAVVVNPGPYLTRVAESRGWRVLEARETERPQAA